MQTQNFDNDTQLTGTSGADAHAKLDQAASKAHETVDRVHRRATHLTDRATSEGDRMYNQACSWVSAHPMQAVAGALVAGYLFGRIKR